MEEKQNFQTFQGSNSNVIKPQNELEVSDKIISLPCHLDITTSDIDFIVDRIQSILE